MGQSIVDSTNTPVIINVSEYTETTSVVCTPSSATYTVEYSCSPVRSTSPNWVSDTDLTAATTQKTVEFGKITRLRVTLVSGTSVAVDVL